MTHRSAERKAQVERRGEGGSGRTRRLGREQKPINSSRSSRRGVGAIELAGPCAHKHLLCTCPTVDGFAMPGLPLLPLLFLLLPAIRLCYDGR